MMLRFLTELKSKLFFLSDQCKPKILYVYANVTILLHLKASKC